MEALRTRPASPSLIINQYSRLTPNLLTQPQTIISLKALADK